MVSLELIQTELQRLIPEELSRVYRYIKQISREKSTHARKRQLLAVLGEISIEGRKIFSIHHDFYAAQEQNARPDVD